MALNDFVKVIKKSALLAHLQNVDEKTAKWRKDLLDAIITKDELVTQLDYLSDSHADLTDRDLDDQHPASAIAPDVTDFDGGLSATDDDLQTALETIDDDLGHAIHDNVDAEISAITEKTTPVNADIFIIEDSEASYAKKKLQMGKIVIGGSSQDDVIEFDDSEGYVDDALLSSHPDGLWTNVIPPEEDDSPHWKMKDSQSNYYFEGTAPFTFPDDAVLHTDDAATNRTGSYNTKHFCARYNGSTYSDGTLDIYFRLHSDSPGFVGIVLCDRDEFSQTTGLYCGQNVLESGTSTPGQGFILTTNLSDASWQADEDKEYTTTWGYGTTYGMPTNSTARTTLAYFHHLQVDLLAGTAKHRAWNCEEAAESTIYPTDSDWGATTTFNHLLGNPIAVFLFADKTSLGVPLNQGYADFFSLRILNTIGGVVIEDGIQHDDLGGLGDDDHMQYLLADGTRDLTGDWDVGSYEIRASTFESDVATGTSPFTIASTTLVTNLNADLLDGEEATAFADAVHTHVEADITDLDHTDATAIHDNVAGEINAVADKATPASTDVVLIEDSADSWAKKKVTISDISSGEHNHDDDYISILDDAIAGNFASLTFGGEISDSGWDASDFALYGHTHAGGDSDAIHDNVSAEIQAIAAKSPPVGADIVIIEDSEATWAKKQVTLTDVVSLAAGGETDHGALDGLADDDHTQYLLADGTRGLSAAWDAGSWEITAETFTSDVAIGTPPLSVTSTTTVTNLDADSVDGSHAADFATSGHTHDDAYISLVDMEGVDAGDFPSITAGGELQGSGYAAGDFSAAGHTHADYLNKNGTVALTANWDAGSFEITAQTLAADVATGTAPLKITSTTAVGNLNADLLDGQHGAYYAVVTRPTIKLTVRNDTGSNMTALDLVYISGSSGGVPQVVLADADGSATSSKMLAILSENINNGASGAAIVYGYISGLSSLTTAGIYYVHTTEGDITNTAPTGTGDIVRIVGYALSTTELWFDPDNTYIQIV